MFKNFSQKNQLGGGQLHPLYASDNKLFQKEIITFFFECIMNSLANRVRSPPLPHVCPTVPGGPKELGGGGKLAD